MGFAHGTAFVVLGAIAPEIGSESSDCEILTGEMDGMIDKEVEKVPC